MQKLFFFVAFLIQTLAYAQPSAPRYVLVEHVTNSRCSVCASRNPAMYTLLGQYETAVHHLAYHPSFPYSNCIFYQANTTENNARAAYYDVTSTPKVILNGGLVAPATTLLPAAKLTAELNQTSPIYVQVTETATEVKVTLHTIGAVPSGNYALYVAFAEQTVNYNAPNGEAVHHDVFRDMLTNIDGEPITLAATGGNVSFTYTKTTNANWNASEMYAIAWVQNTLTKEVPNSGTKFDPIVSGVNQIVEANLALSPNPATDMVYATINDDQPQSVEVYAINGALVAANWTATDNRLETNVADLTPGIYFLRVQGKKGVFVGKFVKE